MAGKHPHLSDAECAAMLIITSTELAQLMEAAREAGTVEELLEDDEVKAIQAELEELAPFAARWAEANAPKED